MASSSVSQESIDIEDYDLYARRSRIRTMRGRATAQHKTEYHESMESGDTKDGIEDDEKINDETSDGAIGGAAGEHESPTRLANRLKDKRIIRPTHLHKPKVGKDKRKLREKRRSAGVMHMQQPSTESTGDSLDEDELRKNTQYNEFIDADNPQTPEEERKAFPCRSVRNKSPSDLEADLEDNQDYDSTVSQSETNLSSLVQNISHNNSSSSSNTTNVGTCNVGGTASSGKKTPAFYKTNINSITGPTPTSCDIDKIASSPVEDSTNDDGGGVGGKAYISKKNAAAGKIAAIAEDKNDSSSSAELNPNSTVCNSSHHFHSQQQKDHHAKSSQQLAEATAEDNTPTLKRNERSGSQATTSSLGGVSAPVNIRPNSQVRWKEPSSVDFDSRRRHKVHWQTSEGSTSPSNNSNTAGSVEELDISTRLKELEQILSRERQERLREKEERQKLRELLYEREKTIEDLQKEIASLHQYRHPKK